MVSAMGHVWVIVFMSVQLCGIRVLTSRVPKPELDPEYWLRSGERELFKALNTETLKEEAKNVIIFLGDGMGVSTVTATRIYKGQLNGKPGEEEKLVFEEFPNVALSKTYNVDHQIPDSAATATAFLCGVKANFGTVGLDPRAKRGHCQRSKGKNATCILELFQKAGKGTGIVTTSRITHATPAPLYASSADRNWEDDTCLPHSAKLHGCQDTAAQLLNSPGKDINVLFAGGRKHMLPKSDPDPEYPTKNGQRKDGRNLIQEWIHGHHKKQQSAKFVWNSTDFWRLPHDIDHVMGLFEYSHMNFEADRHPNDEPSLADMTEKAIKILNKHKKGFFLLVEGARIDHAHHANSARVAMEETLALEEAVTSALQLVDIRETLVIVTADHSHSLSIASHATRGNSILGLTDYSDDTNPRGISEVDKLPYTTLNYATGPGNDKSYPRKDLTYENTESRMYRQATVIPLTKATHEGSDVAIYAKGPWAHLFQSTHEQHYIFHVMAYASCTQKLAYEYPHCKHYQSKNVVIKSDIYGIGSQHSQISTSSVFINSSQKIIIALSLIMAFLLKYFKS